MKVPFIRLFLLNVPAIRVTAAETIIVKAAINVKQAHHG
jgi:hypothetical protein